MDHDKPTVLYVDDESMNLKLFHATLHKEYDILLAESPKEAFEILKTREVQVLVSDQRMPEMTGTEFLEIVAKEYPDTRRFLLTAFTDAETVIEAVNIGKVHGYFKKPLDTKGIKQSINNSLEVYDLRKKNHQILKELEEANTELRNLDGLKSGIINSINSEIRNPLNRIMGTLQLLKSKTEGEELSEVVNILDQSVIRLEQFYTLTKLITLLNSPGFQLEKAELSFRQLIQYAVIETSGEMKEKGIGISWDHVVDDHVVSGDSNLIVSCLVNLLRFASEHVERGEEIGVDVEPEEEKLVCYVEDKGRNYAHSQQDILLDIYSLENTQMNLTMGIGIAVSRMIMEAHGGHLVYLKSEENRGRLKMIFLNE